MRYYLTQANVLAGYGPVVCAKLLLKLVELSPLVTFLF